MIFKDEAAADRAFNIIVTLIGLIILIGVAIAA